MRSLLAKSIVITAGVIVLFAFGTLIGHELESSVPGAGSATAERTHDHEIDFQVMAVGGTEGSSQQYVLRGTAAQAAVSEGNSDSYVLQHGFWHGYCYPGDADASGAIDIDDVVYLIAYIFSGGSPPTPMQCCGDADTSCGVDIDDVVYLIAYIFAGGAMPEPACYICGLF